MRFEVVNERFRQKGCILTTIKDEYKSIDRVEFIGQCGHQSNSSISNFTTFGTGLLCKECSDKNRKKILKEKGGDARLNEYEGFVHFKTILGPHFEIHKTNEGCIADLCIRPLGTEEDKWLRVQTKTTKQTYKGSYVFRTNYNTYEDCIILCLCLQTDDIWALHWEESKGKDKITIGKTGKKHTREEIVDKLKEAYKIFNLYTLSDTLTPKSIYQRREHEYRLKRERMFPHIQFKYPEVEGQKYDFMIGDLKFQEKVAGKRKDRNNHYVAHLYSCNRNKTKYQQYSQGDADYYWFWLDGTDDFYVIPESILVERGLVGCENLRPAIHFTENNWTSVYSKNSLHKLTALHVILSEMHNLPEVIDR